jgi:hypothetical protein
MAASYSRSRLQRDVAFATVIAMRIAGGLVIALALAACGRAPHEQACAAWVDRTMECDADAFGLSDADAHDARSMLTSLCIDAATGVDPAGIGTESDIARATIEQVKQKTACAQATSCAEFETCERAIDRLSLR